MLRHQGLAEGDRAVESVAGLGGTAEASGDVAEAGVAGRQAVAVDRRPRIVVGQLLEDRGSASPVLGLRLRRPALSQRDREIPKVAVADRQAVVELGDGGVVVGQLLVDRDRLPVLGLRRDRPARIRQEIPEVAVAGRQAVAELGDGGVVVGQLPLDRDRLPVLGLRLRRPARRGQEEPGGCCGWPPGCRRKSETAGSSASFWWIAIALPVLGSPLPPSGPFRTGGTRGCGGCPPGGGGSRRRRGCRRPASAGSRSLAGARPPPPPAGPYW